MNRSPARAAGLGALALLMLLLVPLAAAKDGMSLQQVALTRSVTDVAIQPQGGAIAYILSVPRVPGQDKDGPAWAELHVVDTAGRSRPYISGQVNVAAPRWLPDGGIVFLMRGAGDNYRSLYRIPFDGGGAQRLRMLDSDIRNFSVSPDGQQVALVALEPEDPELKAMRDKGFNAQVVEEGTRRARVWIAALDDPAAAATPLEIEGSVQSVHWSPAGDRLALVVTPNERIDDVMVAARVRIVRARDGRELGRVDNPGKLGQLAWNTDGSQLAIISAQDANDPREGRLTVVGRDGGVQRDLLPGLEGHVWNLQWRDPHRMVFISNEGTATRIGEVDLDGNQRTLLARDTPVYSRLALARDGRLALVGSTPQHPPEVFTLAAGVHAPQRLTDNNPWLADVTLARQEVVRYTARDGLEIEGILVHPLQRRRNAQVPLLLFVHGGPESHVSNGWVTSYSQPVQHAAAKGFASFLPNYRASTGRGVAFSKLNHGRPAQEEFDDLIDGVEHLVASGLVDRSKVGISGGSYGGYATAWGATWYSEHFAAAVMFVAITDKIGLLGTSDIPNEFHRSHYQVWPWEDWDLFTRASPIRHVQRNRTPTLILHGDADPRVDPTQSRSMYRYLKLAGKAPVRLVLYPGEGHGNARAASRWDYSLRLMQWMEHYLQGPGGEPPAARIDYRFE
ncbi:S9 family peptidase [Denitratimonas sp. CY0512]|uniref:S9 family peptidase n=1 Tax=Denitratimonas sp. CY0512 TaxID=3131940 RepID=UPI0030A949D6